MLQPRKVDIPYTERRLLVRSKHWFFVFQTLSGAAHINRSAAYKILPASFFPAIF